MIQRFTSIMRMSTFGRRLLVNMNMNMNARRTFSFPSGQSRHARIRIGRRTSTMETPLVQSLRYMCPTSDMHFFMCMCMCIEKNHYHYLSSTSTSSSSSSSRSFASVPFSSSSSKSYKNKYTNVSQASMEFLHKVEDGTITDPAIQTKEISRLMQEWAALQSQSQSQSQSRLVENGRHSNKKTRGVDNNHNYNSNKDMMGGLQLCADAEIVHRLAHVLMDAKENPRTRTTTTTNTTTNTNTTIGTKTSSEDRTHYLSILNLALRYWAKSPPSKINGKKAHELLSRMEDLGILDLGKVKTKTKMKMKAHGNSNVNVNVNVNENVKMDQQQMLISYHTVIRAWAAATVDQKGLNGALKALELLERLSCMKSRDDTKTETKADTWPILQMYNICMNGFAKRGMIKEAEEVLHRLEDMSKTDPNMAPDTYTFSSCINAYLKGVEKNRDRDVGVGVGVGMDSKTAAQRAEDILQRMIQRYEGSGGDDRYRPNQTTFGTVISLFSKSNGRTAAEDADRVLQRLIHLYDDGDENHGNAVHGKKNENPGGLGGEQKKHADPQWLTIDEGYQDGSYSLQPGTGHFVSVLLAYQRRGYKAKESIQRIEELLVQMDALYEAGNDKVAPTYQCFVIYIDALAKSGNAEKAQEALKRIETLMVKEKSFGINNYGYNLVIDAWAKSAFPGRATRAQAVIDRMKKLAAQTDNESLLPDALSYTCLLNAIIQDKEAGFVERCEEVVRTMEAGGGRAKPDVVSYNSIIKAYTLARTPEKAEAVLAKMEGRGISPNRICYNNVMNAYCKSGSMESLEKALSILERMENSSAAATPDVVSYVICLDAVGKSRLKTRVQVAENLVERCLEFARNNSQLSKTKTIFHTLQLVYSRSDDLDKHKKALSVIKMMEDNGLRPELPHYNLVLSACSRLPLDAKEHIKDSAINMAASVLNVLQSSKTMRLDSAVYCNFFWVCNLITSDKEKSQTIEALFKKCCADGLLDKLCIVALKRVAGNQFWSLVGRNGGHVDIASLDPSWSRNAVRINLPLRPRSQISSPRHQRVVS